MAGGVEEHLDDAKPFDDRTEEVPVTVFHPAQRALGPLALHGVPEGPDQPVALSPALDQVILGAFLESLQTQLLIIQPGLNHDRQVGKFLHEFGQRFQTHAVRETQVQQDEVEIPFSGDLESFRRRLRPHDGERRQDGLLGGFGDQPKIRFVILHHQQRRGRGRHEVICLRSEGV